MVVHLAAGAGDLLADQFGQRPAFLRGGIAEDGQRRVHRMGQVAGLRARALHHVGVHIQHMVEFLHQGAQFLRKPAFEARRCPLAHVGQALAQQLQRPQRQAQLQHHGQHQPGRQRAQCGDQHGGEALHGLGQQGAVGRNDQAQRRRIGLGQLQGACHGHELVALAIGQHAGVQRRVLVVLIRAAGIGAELVPVQRLVPQRTRAQQAGLLGRTRAIAHLVDLPVQARQRLRQARVAHGQPDLDAPSGQAVDGCAELVELQHQLRLQLLRDVVAEQAAQPPAGQQHGRQHPGQRAGQQAQAQRIPEPGYLSFLWRVHAAGAPSTSR